MHVRTAIAVSVAAWLCATSQLVSAQTAQNAKPDTRIVAVLVQVDNRGTVTGMAPDVPLPANLGALLRQTLDRMITRPAHDAHGKAMASQLVLQFSLNTQPRAGGGYSVQFAYLKAKSLPAGVHYTWTHAHNGKRPALVDTDAARRLAIKRPVDAVMSTRDGQGAMKRNDVFAPPPVFPAPSRETH